LSALRQEAKAWCAVLPDERAGAGPGWPMAPAPLPSYLATGMVIEPSMVRVNLFMLKSMLSLKRPVPVAPRYRPLPPVMTKASSRFWESMPGMTLPL
jgi:hypothetical protein